MTITELSERSGVPVATIKYYVREGLLQPGDRAQPNRTDYGETHVDRLRVIRALREVGGLGVATLRRVFAALAPDSDHPRRYIGIAMDALSDEQQPAPRSESLDRAEFDAARREVAALVEELGWRVSEREPAAQRDLARALVTARRVLRADFPARALLPYAEAVGPLARREIAAARGHGGAAPEDVLRRAVVGTVIMEPVLIALRRLALRAYANRPPPPDRAASAGSPSSLGAD